MKYEIKKLIYRKELWIVFGLSIFGIILLSLREPWASFSLMRISQEKTSAYWDLPLNEAARRVELEVDALPPEASDISNAHYADWLVLTSMKKSAQEYQKHENSMKMRILQMYEDLEHAATEYERRDLTQAIALYNRKTQYRLCNHSQLLLALLSHEHDDAMQGIYLLVLCMLLAPIFAAEYETGMFQILYASPKGKRGLFRKKIIGGILCASVFAILYTIIVFAIIWIKYGLPFQLLLAPIQCATLYQNCPYAVNILGFIALTVCMRAVIGMFIMAVIALLSCFLRRTLAIFGAASGIVAILFLLWKFSNNAPQVQTVLKQLGLIRLSHLGDYLAQYDTVNVLGYPIAQLWLSVTCTCCMALCILCISNTVYTSMKRRVK